MPKLFWLHTQNVISYGETLKIFVYARMRRDENNAESKYQAMTSKCSTVIAAVSSSMSFYSRTASAQIKLY